MTTDSRAARHSHPRRVTFRRPSAIDWRIVAPAPRRVLDLLGRIVSANATFSGRSVAIASTASSLGTAVFVLGMIALFHGA